MLSFWKKFRYVVLGGVALSSFGCSGGWFNGVWQVLWGNGLTYAVLEFLTDNNGIFDLFTDN